jgi:mono/diheme cytochrome c family protein
MGVATSLAACASPRRGEPIAGPFTASDPAIARGQQVFMRSCHQCHPGGEAGVGPAINDKPLPGFLIKAQVRAGVGAMPRFSEQEIPAAELDDLVRFVKAQRRNPAPG